MVHPFENILFSRTFCLFVTWVFGDTFRQDRRTVARFLGKEKNSELRKNLNFKNS